MSTAQIVVIAIAVVGLIVAFAAPALVLPRNRCECGHARSVHRGRGGECRGYWRGPTYRNASGMRTHDGGLCRCSQFRRRKP